MKKADTTYQSLHRYVKNGGEMGELIRSFDWEATVLGNPDAWPLSLLTTLGIIVHSKCPMFLWWGTDLIQFYNDAFRPSLGKDNRHPAALGQRGEDCWPEVWPVIKPLIDQVMDGGEATWSVDQLIPIFRNGKMEDVYWTFSYSAVNGETGGPEGVLVICNETTDLVAKMKAKEELKKSEEIYQILFTSSPLAKWVYEFDTLKILDVNDSALRRYGYTREEFLNMTAMDLRPPEEIPRFMAARNVIQWGDGTVYPGTFTHQRKDKTKLEVEIWGARFLFKNIPSLMIVANDLTESLYYQKLDKLESDILQIKFKVNSTLHEVLMSYLKGIEELHPGMLCSMQQVKNGQIFAMASSGLPKQFLDAIEGVKIGPNVGSCGTAAFTRQKVIVTDIANDPRWADYKEVAARFGLKACWSTPLFDRSGAVTATFANYFTEVRKPTELEENTINRAGRILQVILENFQREESLRESNEKYFYATEATSDAIWDWDLLTETISWGQGYKTIFGYDEGLVTEDKQAITAHIHPEDTQRVLAGLDKAINSLQTHWQDEYRYIKHDGTYAYVIDKGVIIRDAEGRATRMVGAMQDITKQHQKEEMLKSLNEKLIEISWIQSHVIRAPLTRIMGLIQVIKDLNLAGGDKEQALEYLLTSAHELDGVIKNISDKSAMVK
jgi:PAS domain S-box-containing protein